MRTLIEEHGGAVITVAVVVLVIAAIVASGNGDLITDTFQNLLSTFASKAESAAGL